MRILIVDDDPIVSRAIALLVRRELRGWPVDIDTAESAAEAHRFAVLGDIAFHPYRVICTDVRMPGGTGFDLARRLFEGVGLSTPPRMIFMSANVDPAGIRDAAEFQAELLDKMDLPAIASAILRLRPGIDLPSENITHQTCTIVDGRCGICGLPEGA